MSLKVLSIPSSLSHIPNSRMPGVSITMPPEGRRNNSLRVVVCLPLSSLRSPFVFSRSFPNRRLIRVDFPTPEEPIKAIVFPSEINGRSSLYPFSSVEVVTRTSIPKATADTSESLFSKSSHRSDFVRIMTGMAPLSHAIEIYRSNRLRLKSWFNAMHRNTVSMFAATICSCCGSPAAFRTKAPFRGRTDSMMALLPDLFQFTSTKSPTAG